MLPQPTTCYTRKQAWQPSFASANIRAGTRIRLCTSTYMIGFNSTTSSHNHSRRQLDGSASQNLLACACKYVRFVESDPFGASEPVITQKGDSNDLIYIGAG